MDLSNKHGPTAIMARLATVNQKTTPNRNKPKLIPHKKVSTVKVNEPDQTRIVKILAN